MTSFLNKFKIPTLLGVGIIMLGMVAGIYLVLKDRTSLITQASPDIIPQDITLTNIEEQSVTISWHTFQQIPSFVTFGQSSPDEQTVLDDRDKLAPGPRFTHYVTIENLQPQSIYLARIISGKYRSEVIKFQTAATLTPQTGLNPVIGSVFNKDTSLDEGIVYLTIANATAQSALIKNLGNFLIPLSKISRSDLKGSFQPTGEETGKLTVVSDKGQATAVFKIESSGQLLPPLRLGQNLDLVSTPDELNKFDLNDDGLINANDHAIILQNFGKDPQNKKADLNKDGVVDQKDLDLMSQKVTHL